MITVFTCNGCKHELDTVLYGAKINGKDYCCLCDCDKDEQAETAPEFKEPKQPTGI